MLKRRRNIPSRAKRIDCRLRLEQSTINLPNHFFPSTLLLSRTHLLSLNSETTIIPQTEEEILAGKSQDLLRSSIKHVKCNYPSTREKAAIHLPQCPSVSPPSHLLGELSEALLRSPPPSKRCIRRSAKSPTMMTPMKKKAL